MAALSEFFSHLYNITTLFFTVLLIEVEFLFRSLTESLNSGKRRIATTQFLDLIEQKNPTILYTSSGFRPSDNGECAVCLSKYEEGDKIRMLQCKHTFHKDCLDRWLQQDYATCPLCRRGVLPEAIASKFLRREFESEYYGSDEELIFLLSAIHGNNLHRLL